MQWGTVSSVIVGDASLGAVNSFGVIRLPSTVVQPMLLSEDIPVPPSTIGGNIGSTVQEVIYFSLGERLWLKRNWVRASDYSNLCRCVWGQERSNASDMRGVIVKRNLIGIFSNRNCKFKNELLAESLSAIQKRYPAHDWSSFFDALRVRARRIRTNPGALIDSEIFIYPISVVARNFIGMVGSSPQTNRDDGINQNNKTHTNFKSKPNFVSSLLALLIGFVSFSWGWWNGHRGTGRLLYPTVALFVGAILWMYGVYGMLVFWSA